MARACEAVPGILGVHTIPSSSPHVIRCIRSRQFDINLSRIRVIVFVQCSGGRSSYLPRILAGVCHAVVIYISQQIVKIGKYHILVDRTVYEKSRVRGVPADASDKLAAQISTAVMLAPRLADCHSSIP